MMRSRRGWVTLNDGRFGADFNRDLKASARARMFALRKPLNDRYGLRERMAILARIELNPLEAIKAAREPG
jgi:hypothetical protein